jgi:hypothetical protein
MDARVTPGSSESAQLGAYLPNMIVVMGVSFLPLGERRLP